MNRNVSKNVNEYDTLFERRGGRSWDLYASEVYQLLDLCTGSGNRGEDEYQLIVNSFKFGFLQGYRAGKKASKNRAT